jgi:hypothetical protein
MPKALTQEQIAELRLELGAHQPAGNAVPEGDDDITELVDHGRTGGHQPKKD